MADEIEAAGESERVLRGKKSVADATWPLFSQAAESNGAFLYDLEYVREGGNRILRAFIDKDGGVGLSDCERVSRAAEAMLDECDPIPEAYVLEVSSPGIERRLRKDWHFEKYAGSRVEVRLYKQVEGKKNYRGELTGFENGLVELTDENGDRRSFGRRDITVCRLVAFE